MTGHFNCRQNVSDVIDDAISTTTVENQPMKTWPNRRILDLLGIELPIVQAPMAGVATSAMAVAVAEAGGLGSLPCAMLAPDQIRMEIAAFRRRTRSHST